MSLENWTPVAFNLYDGLPFTYSEHVISEIAASESAISEIAASESAISEIPATKAFVAKVNQRDNHRCIVCGHSSRIGLHHTHIIPKVENETWEDLRMRHFIPMEARSVEYEARNGILLCKNHHALFGGSQFYIRWVPVAKCFVLVNQSGDPSLQPFHGHAVRLFLHSQYLPFHNAFVIHEMRVRGFCPFIDNPIISLPIPWQTWIQDAPDGRKHDDDDGDTRDDNSSGGQDKRSHEAKGKEKHFRPPTNVIPASTSDIKSGLVVPGYTPMDTLSGNAGPHQTMTLTNPFANPAELAALKHSFAEQPNFKALAGSWKGTAEENIKKWQGHGRGNINSMVHPRLVDRTHNNMETMAEDPPMVASSTFGQQTK